MMRATRFSRQYSVVENRSTLVVQYRTYCEHYFAQSDNEMRHLRKSY